MVAGGDSDHGQPQPVVRSHEGIVSRPPPAAANPGLPSKRPSYHGHHASTFSFGTNGSFSRRSSAARDAHAAAVSTALALARRRPSVSHGHIPASGSMHMLRGGPAPAPAQLQGLTSPPAGRPSGQFERELPSIASGHGPGQLQPGPGYLQRPRPPAAGPPRAGTSSAAVLRAASGSLKSSKYEEILFSIIFTMAGRSAASEPRGIVQKRVLPVLFAIADAFQLAGLVNRAGWNADSINWLDLGVNLYPLIRRQIFSLSFASVFWTAAVIVALILGLTVLVGFTMRLQRFRPFPLRILRVLLKLVIQMLFISTLQIFASAYSLGLDPGDVGFRVAPPETAVIPWAAYAGIASVLLFLFVPYAATIALLLVDNNATSYSLDAMAHGRVRLFYLLVQVLLVFASRFLHNQPVLLNFFILLGAFAASFGFIWFQPYFSPAMNRLRSGLLGGVAFFAAASCSLASREREQAGVATCAALIVGVLLFGALCAALCAVRYRLAMGAARATVAALLASSGSGSVTSPRSSAARDRRRQLTFAERWFNITGGFFVEAPVELSTRFAWEYVPRGLAHPMIRSNSLVPGMLGDMPADAPTSDTIAEADPARASRAAEVETIYRLGFDRYRESPYLHVCYASFLQHHERHPHAAILELKQAMTKGPSLDLRYFVSSKRLEAEQADHREDTSGAVGSANFISVLEFQSTHERAKADHALALNLCKTFWAGLAKKAARSFGVTGDLSEVNSQLQKIEIAKRAARHNYRSLLRKFPHSRVLLRSYGCFLADVENEPERAQELLARADELEDQESRPSLDNELGTGAKTGSASHTGSKSSGSKWSAIKKSSSSLAQEREARAVKLLGWAVIAALLVAAGLMGALFAQLTLMFSDLQSSLFRQTKMATQHRTFSANVYWLRMMQLHASEGDEASFLADRARFSERIALQRETCYGLYLYGWPAQGVPPSQFRDVLDAWNALPVATVEYTPSDVNASDFVRVVRTTSLWTAFRRWVSESEEVASLGMDQMRPNASLSNYHVRFLLDNTAIPTGGIGSALFALGSAYAHEMTHKKDQSRAVLSGLLAAILILLACMHFLVLRPSIHRVRTTKNDVAHIIARLPHGVIREISHHFKKLRDLDEDDGSQDEGGHETDEGGKEQGAATAPRSGSGNGDASSVGAGALRGRGRAPAALESPRDAIEPSPRGGDAAEQMYRGPSPLPARADDKEPVGRLPAWLVASPPAGASARRRRDADTVEAIPGSGVASGGSSSHWTGPSPSDREERVGGQSSKAPRADSFQLITTFDLTEEQSPNSKAEGDAGAPCTPRGGERDSALTPVPAPSAPHLLAPRASFTPPDEAAELEGASRRSSAAGAGAGLGSIMPRAADEGLKGARRASDAAGDTDHEARASGAAAAPQGGSSLRRRTKIHPSAAAPGNDDGDGATLREKMDAAGLVLPKINSGMPAGAEEIRRASVTLTNAMVRTKKRDVFFRMRVLAILSVVSLAIIACVIYMMCMISLTDNASVPAEIRMSGLRQYYARQMQTYTLEMMVNDGAIASKGESARRLGESISMARKANDNLMFGNPEEGTRAFDFGAMTDLMYARSCLRTDASECGAANRTLRTDETSKGLDWALTSFSRAAMRLAMSTGALTSNGSFRTDWSPNELIPSPRYDFSGLVRDYPSLADMEEMGLDVDQGCETATRLYAEEAARKIGVILSAEGGVLAFMILVTASVYLFAFRPMLIRLEDECTRASQFLKLVPRYVALRVPSLRTLLDGEQSSDDETGSSAGDGGGSSPLVALSGLAFGFDRRGRRTVGARQALDGASSSAGAASAKAAAAAPAPLPAAASASDVAAPAQLHPPAPAPAAAAAAKDADRDAPDPSSTNYAKPL